MIRCYRGNHQIDRIITVSSNTTLIGFAISKVRTHIIHTSLHIATTRITHQVQTRKQESKKERQQETMALELTSKHGGGGGGGLNEAQQKDLQRRINSDCGPEYWVLKTCRQLKENTWPSERRLFVDGRSCFPKATQERTDLAHVTFLDALLHNNTVTTVTFQNIIFGTQCQSLLETILSGSTKLQCLKLHNVSIKDADGSTSSNSSSSSHLPCALFENLFIQELVIEKCSMNQQELDRLGQMICRSKSLKTVKLIHVSLAEGVVTTNIDAIANALKSSSTCITELDLSQTKLGLDNLTKLLNGLQCNTTLETLILDDCDVEDEHYATSIANFLSQNNNLKELSLNENCLIGDSIRIIVQNGLIHNSSLRTLSLNDNPVGDDGAIYLTDMLRQSNNSSKLQSLSIMNCEIWERGYQALAQGIATMETLQELMVEGPELEEHASELLVSMKQNMTLRNLVMAHSIPYRLEQDDETWNQIFWYIQLNRIKRLLLQKQNTPMGLWPKVLEYSRYEPKFMFYMLQQKPEFCNNVGTERNVHK